MFCKKVILKNFANFTRKYPCQRLVFDKDLASNRSVFCEYFEILRTLYLKIASVVELQFRHHKDFRNHWMLKKENSKYGKQTTSICVIKKTKWDRTDVSKLWRVTYIEKCFFTIMWHLSYFLRTLTASKEDASKPSTKSYLIELFLGFLLLEGDISMW